MIHIGTSGFSYPEWKGLFYPETLPQREWLEYYSSRFDCVEINSSFYHLPKESVVESWNSRVPQDFRFVFKGSRTVTHLKRLKECRESVDLFYERLSPAAGKCAAVLWQLPPGFHLDLERLKVFLGWLPDTPPAVVEFRHASWYAEEIFQLLGDRKAVFCIQDMPDIPCPDRVTGGMLYLRFHGPTGQYGGNYAHSFLRSRAKWIVENAVKEGYAFFNNDIGGWAVQNAMTLRRMLGQEG